MKKSRNILDFFHLQSASISCPACGISLLKSQLNTHLDSSCSSLVDNFKKPSHNSESHVSKNICGKPFSTKFRGGKNDVKTNRLSLKQQRKQASKNRDPTNCIEILKEIEVVTIDDNSPGEVPVNKDHNLGAVTDLDKSDENENLECLSLIKGKSVIVSSPELQHSCSENQSLDNNSTVNQKIDLKPNISSHAETGNNLDFSDPDKSSKCYSKTDSNNLHINNKFETDSNSNSIKRSCCKNDNNPYTISENSVESSNVSINDKHISLSEQDNASSFHTNLDKQVNLNDSDLNALVTDVEGCFDQDDNVFSDKTGSQPYEPYYIANFKHILNAVLSDETYRNVFNDEDRSSINAFETLSDSAQKLYVRLFQRKYKWLRLNKILYPNITAEPGAFLNELVENELVDSGSEKIELETALGLLSLAEAKILAKQFNFNSSGKNKTDIIQMLLKHCKEHKSVFFTFGNNGVSNTLMKKVKQVLGPCYRISLLPKRLFTRILMLFSLPTISEDDDDAAGGQQQQLLTLLQVNKGELTFPSYKINREVAIFADRDELIRYEEAKQLENDLTNAVESKNFVLALELFENAKDEFEEQLSASFVERAAALPTFLKKFTSYHVYVRCMTQGVEVLQRLRKYQEAVDLLRRLLSQKVYSQDYRGRWWDRLALNLEQHLKKRNEALEAIKEAFVDKNVRVGYRFSLLTRALRILKTTDGNDDFKKEVLEAANVLEAPKVVIKGRLCPRNILGRRNVFISSSSNVDAECDVTVLGVEQLAIEHYQNEGFTEGIHGEGSTFHSVYGLLFWDIIYDGDIPDAFISPHQNHPLDLNHESFFDRREKQILSQLERLKNSTIEEIKEIVKSSWEAHFGQTSLVFWDRFSDVAHMLGLIGCMGNTLICGICERLARDFRFTRSGVPDLVVWNPDTLKVKIVEVKGPNDKLSSKQILWLDYLLKLEADAEVCHIEAVGSKKLRKE